jgi:hypothetical protein
MKKKQTKVRKKMSKQYRHPKTWGDFLQSEASDKQLQKDRMEKEKELHDRMDADRRAHGEDIATGKPKNK